MAFVELDSLREATTRTREDWEFVRDQAAGVRRRFEELDSQKANWQENFITKQKGDIRETALRVVDERLTARHTQQRIENWLAFMGDWSRAKYVRKGRLTPSLRFNSADRLSLTQEERRFATALSDLQESSEQTRLLMTVARMSASDLTELYEDSLRANSLATAGLVLRELRYRAPDGNDQRLALMNAEAMLDQVSMPEFEEGEDLLIELKELNGWIRESRRVCTEGGIDRSILWEDAFRRSAAGLPGPRFLDTRTGIASDELPGAVPSPQPASPEARRSGQVVATELGRTA